MDDDVGLLAIDVADFQECRGLAGADDHGQPVTEVPDPDRVAVRVQDVLLAQSMLQRAVR